MKKSGSIMIVLASCIDLSYNDVKRGFTMLHEI